MSRLAAFAVCVLLIATRSLDAQVVYNLDPGLAGVMTETYLPSTTHPAGSPGYHGVIPLPASGALAATLIGGGITIDQATSTVYATDGFTITTDYHHLYSPFTPPPAPTPAAAAPVLLSGGPVSGMGCDRSLGVIWMTDGISYGGYTIGAPFAVVVPPVLLPFPLAGTLLTGLDYDAATGTLWGCDAIGNIYHWFPGGAAIGPQPVSVVPIPAGSPPLGGLAVNDSNGAGAIAPHFCSTQIPGYHVLVSDGLVVWDALAPLNPTIPVGVASGVGTRGLAYANDFQVRNGVGAIPPFPGTPGWAKPLNNGIGPVNALRLTGAPPLTTALFLYDLCPIPGGLFIPASGETLWINPFSITFNFATFVTDIFGDVTFPISLTLAPTGLNFDSQWAVFSPPHPLGYALSDEVRFIIGTN